MENTEERRGNCILHGQQLNDLITEVKSIKKLLMGNGVIGVAEMARRAYECTQEHNKAKNGLLDWAFRAMITILLGYIALKIGLR